MPKHTKAPKHNRFTVLTSEEATRARIPKYNPFQTGHGAHGSSKYDRNTAKRSLQRELRDFS